MLLHFILHEYASKQPDSMKPESETLTPDHSEATGLHDAISAPESDFGKLISRGAAEEETATASADSALLVYTGNFLHHCSVYCKCVNRRMLLLKLSALLESYQEC